MGTMMSRFSDSRGTNPVGTCDFTIEHGKGLMAHYCPCGKKAGWKSPKPILGKIYNLCGTHKNLVNKSYELQELDDRCLKIYGEDDEC